MGRMHVSIPGLRRGFTDILRGFKLYSAMESGVANELAEVYAEYVSGLSKEDEKQLLSLLARNKVNEYPGTFVQQECLCSGINSETLQLTMFEIVLKYQLAERFLDSCSIIEICGILGACPHTAQSLKRLISLTLKTALEIDSLHVSITTKALPQIQTQCIELPENFDFPLMQSREH